MSGDVKLTITFSNEHHHMEVDIVREDGYVAYTYLCAVNNPGHRSQFRAWCSNGFHAVQWEFRSPLLGWTALPSDEVVNHTDKITAMMMHKCALAALVAWRQL